MRYQVRKEKGYHVVYDTQENHIFPSEHSYPVWEPEQIADAEKHCHNLNNPPALESGLYWAKPNTKVDLPPSNLPDGLEVIWFDKPNMLIYRLSAPDMLYHDYDIIGPVALP